MIGNRVIVQIWIVIVGAALTWGAGAFGAPYPWAYRPLLIVCTTAGGIGIVAGRHTFPRSLALCLAAVMIGVLVQLIPMSLSNVAQWSPHAAEIHRARDLQIALGINESASLSIDHAKTRVGLSFLVVFTLLMLGTARLLSRDSARTLVGVIVVVGVALAITGIVQKATFNGKIYGFWELRQGGLPFGPFINRNHFAGWMLMAIPLSLGFLASTVSRSLRGSRSGVRERVLWLASPEASKVILIAFAIAAMMLSLLLTLSRSGMLSLAVALIVLAIVVARRQSIKQQLAFSAYAIFVVVTVAAWAGFDQIVLRFEAGDSVTLSGRPAIWADTIRIIEDFPLTGTGFNTYGISTQFYQRSQPGEHLNEAHSDYLQLVAEGGILLGVPIAAAIVAFVLLVRQRLREDVGSIWWIRVGALSGIFAIAVQSLAEFSLQMPGNAALFSVLAGIALHDGRTV